MNTSVLIRKSLKTFEFSLHFYTEMKTLSFDSMVFRLTLTVVVLTLLPSSHVTASNRWLKKNIKDIKSGIKSIARDVNGEPGN